MNLLGAIISDYKSVRHAEVPLGGLTVLCGPNGVGKTNLIEALGAYDPLAKLALSRTSGIGHVDQPRVALVTQFDVAADGTGPDASLLLEMIAAPWAAKIPAMEIPEGIGAYCGSCWWLNGGDLYSEADRASLPATFQVIKDAFLAGVPDALRGLASDFLNLLLDKPILFVQEDFAVDLSCDRQTEKGRELRKLSEQLTDLPGGVFEDLLGPFRDWTARWPPLILLTRGPGAVGTGAPVGFGWVTERFGGVQAVSVDVNTVETYLDQALEQAHDRLQHRPEPEEPELGDELCSVCLQPTHGGRVNPEIYSTDIPDDELPFQGSPTWLEEQGGWVRVRPTLRDTLAVIERRVNDRIPSFVAEHGQVRLGIRPVTQWDASPSRCQIMFNVDPGHADPEPANWDGPIGVLGYTYGLKGGILQIPLADLGAGMRRWVATVVRQAADAFAMGEISAVRWVGQGANMDQNISEPPTILADDPVQPRILVIDEPEQHLHPHAQEVIAGWASEQASRHHAVLVATHSPAFFALPPERATICQVYRVGHETIVRPLPEVHDIDVVTRARQLGFELGLGREALAQLTRAVIVVEGEWDRQMLLHFYSRELHEQRILVVPLQGSDELGGLADAAVIPALGVPVVALLDEVRANSWEELAELRGMLTKAERCLRDLAVALGPWLRIVRYEDPDVICALPEAAVLRAFPASGFLGWDDLLEKWRIARVDGSTSYSFKRWALETLTLSRSERKPDNFFRHVLEHANIIAPDSRFSVAFQCVLDYVNQ